MPSCKVVPDLNLLKDASVTRLVLGERGEEGRLLFRPLSELTPSSICIEHNYCHREIICDIQPLDCKFLSTFGIIRRLRVWVIQNGPLSVKACIYLILRCEKKCHGMGMDLDMSMLFHCNLTTGATCLSQIAQSLIKSPACAKSDFKRGQ